MRPSLFTAILFLLLSHLSHGQTTPLSADSARLHKYTYVETMPVFPGGKPGETGVEAQKRIIRFLQDSLRVLPALARDGVAGRVSFAFIVNVQGRTENIRLVETLRADADAEVLRNAHRLDRIQWQPGTQNGRPVSVSFTVPISFNRPVQSAKADSLDGPTYRKRAFPLRTWGTDRRAFPAGEGIVYGSCIQRLGFESGGLGQYVRLVNLSTGKPVTLEVKPPMRSRKQHTFCYALPPGRYALYQYEYSVSKWYGAEIHDENLRKPARAAATTSLNGTRFRFTVAPGKLHYLGTWNLEKENAPVFHNDKAALDAQLTPLFKILDFTQALVAVPQ
ncbi:MAG: energy transducer TonB [Bacteroidota bacterium]|nr:energy transducer TonB [Bacteroidota bacterium]